MNIVIIGTGYVGLVTGVGLASHGNFVNFIDLDENIIKDLSSKKITFYEPGLEEYFNDDETFKRMSFSSDYASIEWDNIDIVFVCVQTPNNIETNSVDTKFLESAIKEINNVNNNDLVITVKSTIPPYEIEKVCEKVGMDSSKLMFNPEFLRECTAVDDFFNPDRIVLPGFQGNVNPLHRYPDAGPLELATALHGRQNQQGGHQGLKVPSPESPIPGFVVERKSCYPAGNLHEQWKSDFDPGFFLEAIR